MQGFLYPVYVHFKSIWLWACAAYQLSTAHTFSNLLMNIFLSIKLFKVTLNKIFTLKEHGRYCRVDYFLIWLVFISKKYRKNALHISYIINLNEWEITFIRFATCKKKFLDWKKCKFLNSWIRVLCKCAEKREIFLVKKLFATNKVNKYFSASLFTQSRNLFIFLLPHFNPWEKGNFSSRWNAFLFSHDVMLLLKSNSFF